MKGASDCVFCPYYEKCDTPPCRLSAERGYYEAMLEDAKEDYEEDMQWFFSDHNEEADK